MCCMQCFCHTSLMNKHFAACFCNSILDQSHTHISKKQESERPSVPSRAVHSVQNDCKCIVPLSLCDQTPTRNLTPLSHTTNQSSCDACHAGRVGVRVLQRSGREQHQLLQPPEPNWRWRLLSLSTSCCCSASDCGGSFSLQAEIYALKCCNRHT